MKRVLRLKPLISIEIIIACLLGLFGTAALANSRHLIWGETGLLKAIYSLPDSLTPMFLAITLIGSPWILALLMAWLLALERPKRAIYAGLVGVTTLLLVEIGKRLVARPRPMILVHREQFVTGFGFPSGHTALATALAFSIYPWLPKKWRWLTWIWIFAVALSRLYLGVHAPLDIIGGFMIGVLAAICVQLTVVPENRKRLKTRIAKTKK